MKFSLPYIDQPPKFWKNIVENYTDSINEIYFPLNLPHIPSGRPLQANKFIDSFLKISNIPKAVIVNPIILPVPFEQVEDAILKELNRLNCHFGVCKVTVKDLLLLKSIKTNLPKFKTTASVLMGINSMEQLEYLQNYADELVPDSTIVRDIKKMQKIRNAYKGILKLMVNEGCLAGCPFRIQHFFEMTSKLIYPKSLCDNLLKELPWLRLKSSWILPQHLHFYEGIYDVIKIAGRVTLKNPQKYLAVFESYLNRNPMSANSIGSGPAGMIEDIPISDEFFELTINCEKNCSDCNFCKVYYDNHRCRDLAS